MKNIVACRRRFFSALKELINLFRNLTKWKNWEKCYWSGFALILKSGKISSGYEQAMNWWNTQIEVLLSGNTQDTEKYILIKVNWFNFQFGTKVVYLFFIHVGVLLCSFHSLQLHFNVDFSTNFIIVESFETKNIFWRIVIVIKWKCLRKGV